MSAHAACGPSSLARRIACPGSLEAEQGKPDTPSDASTRGTFLHAIFAELVKDALEPFAMGLVYESDALEIMEAYSNLPADDIEMINDLADTTGKMVEGCKPTTVMIEQSVNPAPFFDNRDDVWGTADLIFFTEDTLFVFDLKTGHHIVDPGCMQLMAYAMGAVSEYTILHSKMPETVILGIIQPANDKGDIQIKKFSWNEFVNKSYEISKALREATADGTRRPGDHCHFCKAKYDCPEKAGEVNNAVDHLMAFTKKNEDIPVKEAVENVPLRDLAQLARDVLIVKVNMNGIERAALTRLQAGEDLPGLAIGYTNPRPIWLLPMEELEKKFKGKMSVKEYRKVTLQTPTVLKKARPDLEEFLDKFVEVPEGAPKLILK